MKLSNLLLLLAAGISVVGMVGSRYTLLQHFREGLHQSDIRQVSVSQPFHYVSIRMTSPSMICAFNLKKSSQSKIFIQDKALAYAGAKFKNHVMQDTLFIDISENAHYTIENYQVGEWPNEDHKTNINVFCPNLKGISVEKAYCIVEGFDSPELQIEHSGMGLTTLRNCRLGQLQLRLSDESKLLFRANNQTEYLSAELHDNSQLNLAQMPRRPIVVKASPKAYITVPASSMGQILAQ